MDMVQPPGFEQCDKIGYVLVCQLHRAFYGIKHTPMACLEKLKHFFVYTLQFVVSLDDNCLFIKSNESSIVFHLVYVYDMVVTGSDFAVIETVITKVNFEFQLNDLGLLNCFLDMDAGW